MVIAVRFVGPAAAAAVYGDMFGAGEVAENEIPGRVCVSIWPETDYTWAAVAIVIIVIIIIIITLAPED
jgi:hypothetical protein